MDFRRSMFAKLQRVVLAALLAVIVGCSNGDDPLEPDLSGQVPRSSGGGSGTLVVVADISAREVGASTFETGFVVTVGDSAGNPVAGAVVTVSGGFGAVRLAEGVPGSYTALRPDFEGGSYTLNVRAGPDSVTAVTTHAPSMHTITKPAPGDSVTAGVAINVRWDRGALSDECRLETLDYDSGWIYGDPGTLWAPGIGNPARTDQRVSVERRNFEIPAGGRLGSHFSVRLRRSVEPIVSL
jgi:hypothetical protein